MKIQTDIEKLESQIRQLKIQYDMFFAGAIPKQPYELRKEVENMIRKYAHSPHLSYAQRFHFNSLVSRFNSFLELWSKTLRDLEEKGKSPVFAQMTEPPASSSSEPGLVAIEVFSEEPDIERIRHLHSKYIDARREAGEKNVNVSFDNFSKQIIKQTSRMRENTKCTTIEVKIIKKDHKVVLTAKAL